MRRRKRKETGLLGGGPGLSLGQAWWRVVPNGVAPRLHLGV